LKREGRRMQFERLVTAIDGHTGGGSWRLVTGGVPNSPGKTMADKRDFWKKNLDHLRRALSSEPRLIEVVCVLTPPVTDGAAFGNLYMNKDLYSDMCGHGVIGVATAAVEMGMVEPVEPVTEITIDTPAGPVHAKVNVENGRAKSATIQGVPSFLYKTELIQVPDLGELPVDIAYGGNFFALVQAKSLGIRAQAGDILNSASLVKQVIKSINQQVEVKHPELDYIKKGLYLLLIVDTPTNPKAHSRNIAVWESGNFIGIDMSPCGTGVFAKTASLYVKGGLRLGETFVSEGINGAFFYGKVLKETSIGSYKGVLPELTGNAYMTGIHNIVLDEADPFKYGFVL
jgi:proline racemase